MNRKSIYYAVMAILSTHVSTNVLAEEATAAKAGIEDVIVTARRKEESIQDIPLAATAFGAAQIEQGGLTSITDLATTVPSFKAVPLNTGRKGAMNYAIRGQKAGDIVISQDPAVIIYMSEIPVMRPVGLASSAFLDVQSAEVLKGPQGTLFGRNSTGGAVLITPNEPTTERVNGSLSIGLGDYNRQTATGIVNVPLSDGWAARLAVQSNRRDGLIKNESGGADFDDQDEKVWRAALKYDGGKLTSTFFTDGYESDDSGTALALTALNPASPLNTGLVPGHGQEMTLRNSEPFYSAHSTVKARSKNDVYGVSNTTAYELSDELSIKNIIGYRKTRVFANGDLDAVDANLLASKIYTNIDQYTEEFQLQGTSFEDKLDWIAGTFYFLEKGDDYSISQQLPGLLGFLPDNLTGGYGRNEAYSVFGQGAYKFTDDFIFTLGLRESVDKREIKTQARNLTSNVCSLMDSNGVPLSPCGKSASADFSKPTWNLTGEYHLTYDSMVYLAKRRGYRTGGLNIRDSEGFKPFQPEIVDDWELGYKSQFDFFGTPLRLNSAIYYSDYKNIQRSIRKTENGQTLGLVENAASAKMKGAEVDLTWLPIDDIELNLSYAYLDAAYDSWESLGVDLSKNKINGVTKNSGSFSARYHLSFIPEEVGKIHVQASVFAQSEQSLDDTNTIGLDGLTTGPGLIQGGYALYNARIDWEQILGNQNLKAALWGKNLANKDYYVGGFNLYSPTQALGYNAAALGEPRTFGVDLTYSFE